MEKWGLALVLLCLFMVTGTVAGDRPTTYSVGGESGWAPGGQISVPTLSAGDSIHFSYAAGQHNVVQVSQADYYACRSSSPWSVHTSGNDYITLSSAGTFFFICSYGNHCNAGMKLVVHVA